MAKRKTWIFGGTFGLLIVGGVVALVLYLTGVFSPAPTPSPPPGPSPAPGPSPSPSPSPGPSGGLVPESDYYFNIKNVRLIPIIPCKPGQIKYSGIQFDVDTNIPRPQTVWGQGLVEANFTVSNSGGRSYFIHQDALQDPSNTQSILFDMSQGIPTGLVGNQLIVQWHTGNNPVVTKYIPFTFPSSMTC